MNSTKVQNPRRYGGAQIHYTPNQVGLHRHTFHNRQQKCPLFKDLFHCETFSSWHHFLKILGR